MKRRVLAMTMAAATAVTALTSTSICAFADGQDSEALASAITIAKTRLDIPEELTEFTYNTVNSNLNNTYTLTWSTPRDSDEYKSVSVNVRGSLITRYYSSDDGWAWGGQQTLAKLTGDELYSKAKALIKKINPTVAGVIDIDRDSLDISLYSDRASFEFVRTKNGVQVQNDRGSIVLDKNTGELLSFNMNWHDKATFKSAKDALSEDQAKEKYAQMIELQPQYQTYYDWENGEIKSRLVYVQNTYGEINAFTGKKSDFSADGYYGDDMDDCVTEDEAESDKGNSSNGGGYDFTEQELAELNKELPYAGEKAVKELLQSDPYLTYKTDMELSYSDLYKVTFGDKTNYYYTAYFTNEKWGYEIEEPVPVYDYAEDVTTEAAIEYAEPAYEPDYQSVNITVDAESGEILTYSFYDSSVESKTQYDLAKADKLAEDIAKKYAGDKFGEYQDHYSKADSWKNGQTEWYSGSSHNWTRYVNGIMVSGNDIMVRFNSDMKLSFYSTNYVDTEFADPKGMLTEKQAMAKFWQDNSLDLYYLARLDNKITKTVLVYGTDNTVYVDAFTGEPVYGYYAKQENDLSGIKNKTIKKMAQALDDHGIIISTEKFSENDPASSAQFESLLNVGYTENGSDKLTKGSALVIFVKSVCGDVVPELKGIYKSPFSDVKDSDKNVGYYAIAYGLGVVSGDKLNANKTFTMGDMIKMVYTLYSGDFAAKG